VADGLSTLSAYLIDFKEYEYLLRIMDNLVNIADRDAIQGPATVLEQLDRCIEYLVKYVQGDDKILKTHANANETTET